MSRTPWARIVVAAKDCSGLSFSYAEVMQLYYDPAVRKRGYDDLYGKLGDIGEYDPGDES